MANFRKPSSPSTNPKLITAWYMTWTCFSREAQAPSWVSQATSAHSPLSDTPLQRGRKSERSTQQTSSNSGARFLRIGAKTLRGMDFEVTTMLIPSASDRTTPAKRASVAGGMRVSGGEVLLRKEVLGLCTEGSTDRASGCRALC